MDDLQPDEAMVEKMVERLESSLDAAIKEVGEAPIACILCLTCDACSIVKIVLPLITACCDIRNDTRRLARFAM